MTNPNDAERLLSVIQERASVKNRFLVAIAGPPGSGKSTIAEYLAAQLGPTAAVIPMDGFHLENDRLTELGLLHRKGAPETFDANGFVQLVKRLRQKGPIPFLTFDRAADNTTPNGGLVQAQAKIILVEGNYLLLNQFPWSTLPDLFNLTVALAVDRDQLQSRLIQRWLDQGLSEKAAHERALSNDMVNADLVISNLLEPDCIVHSS